MNANNCCFPQAQAPRLLLGMNFQFQNLLQDLLARHKGKKAQLARAIGVDPSAVGRWIKGETEGLKLQNILTVANISKMDPREVLKMAGREDCVSILEASVRRMETKPKPFDHVEVSTGEERTLLDGVLTRLRHDPGFAGVIRALVSPPPPNIADGRTPKAKAAGEAAREGGQRRVS